MNQVNLFLKLLTVFSLLWVSVSCSSNDDNDTSVEIDLQRFVVQTITVTDVSNDGDGRDIEISFNAPVDASNVNSFRIYISKTTSTNGFNETIAESLDNSRFLELPNDKPKYTIKLSESIKDTDGDNVTEGVDYQIAILSKYSSSNTEGNILSDFSSTITLTPFTKGVFTIPATFSPGTGLDGITIDAQKNVYVSNFGEFINGSGSGSEVFRITAQGEKVDYGTGLNVPGGLVTDKNDNVYVNNGNNIHKLTAEGVKSLYAQSSVGFAGLVMDENGVIYSGGYGHSLIQKISVDGVVETLVDDNRLRGTVGVAYHQESKSIYAANFDSGKVYKVTMNGAITEFVNLGSTIGYITEMNNSLYATLFNQHQIAKITLNGDVEIIAGKGDASQEDGALLEATFNKPNGIIGDSENNALYVSDWGSPRVSKIQL